MKSKGTKWPLALKTIKVATVATLTLCLIPTQSLTGVYPKMKALQNSAKLPIIDEDLLQNSAKGSSSTKQKIDEDLLPTLAKGSCGADEEKGVATVATPSKTIEKGVDKVSTCSKTDKQEN